VRPLWRHDGALGALAALASLLLAGCGLGAGRAPSSVQLLVTRDFGEEFLHRSAALRVRGQETAMSLLQRNYRVSTRFGGGFVQSIDGISGGQERGGPVDWFYYVNGVEAGKGAAATNVHPGDRIWWDLRDWSQTQHIPAVVGSFPEPFLHGLAGKRLPVRIECASVTGYACTAVRGRLRAAGVPAGVAGLGSSGEPESLRVLVGPWTSVGQDPTAHSIMEGPRASGVYARFSRDGGTITVLERHGRTVRTLHAESGLIAATRRGEDAPVWVVTGTDAPGVDLAARSFYAEALIFRFAVAVNRYTGPFTVPNEQLSRG
jgi:uncharacterized protein DUF4430